MDVKILSTGSKGNVATIDDTIIIDAGANVAVPGQLLLISHSHGDHVKFIDKFASCITYAEPTACAILKEKNPYQTISDITPDTPVTYQCTQGDKGDNIHYEIQPVEMEHDVPCLGWYVTKWNGGTVERIFFATDFVAFKFNEDYTRFKNYLREGVLDAIYIEGNHSLSVADLVDVFFGEDENGEPVVPKDEFHRRRCLRAHCSLGWLIHTLEEAGFAEDRRCMIPITLLHKSKSYYANNPDTIIKLAKIANIQNPLP